MTLPERTPPHFEEPTIPAGLQNALRRLDHAAGDLAELDQHILGEAQNALRRRSKWRIRSAWTAAAAAVMLSGAGAWVYMGARSRVEPAFSYDPSGRTTIVHAFTLARLLKSQEGGERVRLSKSWDVNADTKIDERDVDALAARAVRLTASASGGPSGPGGGT